MSTLASFLSTMEVAQLMGADMWRAPRLAYHEVHHLVCTGPTRRQETGHHGAIPLGVGSRCHLPARDGVNPSRAADLDLVGSVQFQEVLA